jgi:thiamine-phosphate pyrophosphorylase
MLAAWVAEEPLHFMRLYHDSCAHRSGIFMSPVQCSTSHAESPTTQHIMSADPNSWHGLYAIIDVEACGARPPLEIARAVLDGGCAVMQLRAKRMNELETRRLGRALTALCQERGVPFVLNDHVALAAELGADGVHVGQGDMPLSQARAIAPTLCIGLSTHSLAQARQAERLGASVIGFGPVFSTASKDNPDPVVGVAGLAEIVAAVRTPVVAIGGIDLTNIDYVAQTGVPLVACIGAICRAEDPRAAARDLHERIAQR